ncbi:MAG TPA: TonB-dependent receptor [Steroidobacteraceae bacterium]|nr:TonB-dependent receptor [Steroidobacteraceae bacterium]
MDSSVHSGRSNAAIRAGAVGLGCLVAATSHAAGVPTGDAALEEITVTATRIGLIGQSISASQGLVLGTQLEGRPVLRPGEILEVVPGLIVTQHSGEGKANQYFLRGFNLDHGTDFATRVDGLPVNMPTHAHGQGYSDINFLIPELIEEVRYRKGTYYAEEGNFSAAGSVDLDYRNSIESTMVSLTGGEDGYQRALVATSPEVLGGTVLMGVDYSTYDGPWELPQDFRKWNGLAKYSRGDAARGFEVTLMGYDGSWDSTDQIPLRAVEDGTLSRFGYVDPTSGGESHRYSLSVAAHSLAGAGAWSALAYAMEYHLELYSNFTYALDQQNGDQFEQYDDRRVYGGRFDYEHPAALGRFEGHVRTGVEMRYDDIDPVGLFLTRERSRFETIREDQVTQASYSAYVAYETRWSDVVRTELGVRYDYFDFDVDSSLPANSGTASDSIVSPKFTMILGPWARTEFFVNVGRGFHSNDARGTTITVDPTDGVTPVDQVDPLVAALGGEIGVRTAVLPGLQLAASVWGLDLDSELLFVGDGGTTEPSRESRRTGIEIGAFWTPFDWLIVDADLAWSDARFTDDDPAGDEIPGAVEQVGSLGLTVNHPQGWFGGARLRYFGEAPLIEDGSVRSDSTTLLNLEAGYHFTDNLSAYLTVFNVFDAEDNDITYFYESQLPGEPAPVEDIHFHPVEPRTVRATVTFRF